MARLALSQAVQGVTTLGERVHPHNSIVNVQWLPILPYSPYRVAYSPLPQMRAIGADTCGFAVLGTLDLTAQHPPFWIK